MSSGVMPAFKLAPFSASLTGNDEECVFFEAGVFFDYFFKVILPPVSDHCLVQTISPPNHWSTT